MTQAEAIFGRPMPANAVSVCFGGAATVFMPLPIAGWWECHCHADPGFRGRARTAAFRDTLAWWWKRGVCTVLMTHIRRENRAANRLAHWIGMRPLDVIEAPCEDGITRPMTIYRIDRP